MMEITYRNKKIKKIFDSEKNLQKTYGTLSKNIQVRMAQLKAADCLDDIPRVPPPKCHELSENRKGQLSVDLNHNMRLILKPDYDIPPRRDDGGLDWEQVTKIQIIEVVDTHTK